MSVYSHYYVVVLFSMMKKIEIAKHTSTVTLELIWIWSGWSTSWYRTYGSLVFAVDQINIWNSWPAFLHLRYHHYHHHHHHRNWWVKKTNSIESKLLPFVSMNRWRRYAAVQENCWDSMVMDINWQLHTTNTEYNQPKMIPRHLPMFQLYAITFRSTVLVFSHKFWDDDDDDDDWIIIITSFTAHRSANHWNDNNNN